MPLRSPDRVIDEILEEQSLAALAVVDDLRLDPLATVHDARVSFRRLRGTLQGLGPLLVSQHRPLTDHLRWLARELGDVRELQVAVERVVAALEWVPAGPEEDALLRVLEDARGFAMVRATTALADPRLVELKAALEGLLVGRKAEPDLTPESVQKEIGVALQRLLPSLSELDELDADGLHKIRKHTKQARALVRGMRRSQRVFPPGAGAGRVLRRLDELSDQLGHHQDAVTTAVLLRRMCPSDSAASRLAERLATHEDTEALALRFSLGETADRVRQACRRLERRTPGVVRG